MLKKCGCGALVTNNLVSEMCGIIIYILVLHTLCSQQMELS